MKRMKKYIGAVALGTLVLAVPSCSDTWDEHYDGGAGTSATENLWQQISSNPNLSRFAAIAAKTPYYKDTTHPLKKNDGTDFTFKDMLNGTQLLTVWAPENDAFTEEQYQNWLTMAETRPYTVQQQILANSMSLWRNIATGDKVDTLTMLNGKKMEFDKSAPTMQKIQLNEKNIAATNGTLHTLKTPIPFEFNIYEYLKDETNTAVSRFHDYVIATDTTYFDEYSSIEGTPDIDGNPTYVDSVYRNTNTMFFGTKRFPNNNNTDQYLTYQESFGAYIECEDSSFIMVMPTDAAWQNAYSKLEKYYNYADIYVDKEKGNQGTTNIFRQVSNPDSLKEMNINMDIISPLCFNLNKQPNAAGYLGRWNMDDFIASKGASSEYLLNTFGDTLRSDNTWNKSSLFNGKQVNMSNGVGFVADEWAFPLKLYKPNLTVEVGYMSLYNSASAVGTASSVSFSNTAAAKWIDEKGRVSEDNFYYIYPQSATGNPKFEFALKGTHGENQESEVMSGKYDIYVVMVPNYYRTSSDSIDLSSVGTVSQVVNGDTIPLKHKIQATLSYCANQSNGKDKTAVSDLIDYQGEKVDTVLLFKDFEFPYSYKNLRHSYPTIMLTTKTTNSDRKNGYSNDFCIDRFILVSKED